MATKNPKFRVLSHVSRNYSFYPCVVLGWVLCIYTSSAPYCANLYYAKMTFGIVGLFLTVLLPLLVIILLILLYYPKFECFNSILCVKFGLLPTLTLYKRVVCFLHPVLDALIPYCKSCFWEPDFNYKILFIFFVF